MTMRDFLNLLFKRKWTVLVLFFAFAGGMSVVGMYFPPIYHSVASLYLTSKRETIDQNLVDNPTIHRAAGLLLPDVLSEVELVKAGEVRRMAIERAGLDTVPIKAPPPNAPPVDKVAQRAAWDAYLYDNVLIEAATNANVINITVSDGDGKRAAKIAAAYADAYLEFRRTLATNGAPAATIQSEEKLASDKMLAAEAALTDFNTQWKLVDTTTQKTDLIALLSHARTEASDELAALERSETDYNTYKAMLDTDSPEMRNIDEVRSNSNCQSLESQISTQTLALVGLLQHNKETTDQVMRVRESLDTLKKELDDKVHAILRSVVFAKKANVDFQRAGYDVHEKLIKSVEEELQTLVSKTGTNDRLTVDLDLSRDHYKVVSGRVNQNAFDAAIGGTGNIDVLISNHGVVPVRPFFPPPVPICVIVALLTGLVVSISSVIVLDVLDQSFKTSDEVEKALSIPVLATIPRQSRHRLTPLLES